MKGFAVSTKSYNVALLCDGAVREPAFFLGRPGHCVQDAIKTVEGGMVSLKLANKLAAVPEILYGLIDPRFQVSVFRMRRRGLFTRLLDEMLESA